MASYHRTVIAASTLSLLLVGGVELMPSPSFQPVEVERPNLPKIGIYPGMPISLPLKDATGKAIAKTQAMSLLVLSDCSRCKLAQFDELRFLEESPKPFTVLYTGTTRPSLKGLSTRAKSFHKFIDDSCVKTSKYAVLFAYAPTIVNLDNQGRLISMIPVAG